MLSVFDIFKIGIGPSSSHTVGPMRAAGMFARRLERDGLLESTSRVLTSLYGSLGSTGRGHATDVGVILGLLGDMPDAVEPTTVEPRLGEIKDTQTLPLLGRHPISFRRERDIAFLGEQSLPEHPNAFQALDAAGVVLADSSYFSIGGGFVVKGGAATEGDAADSRELVWPYPFSTGAELMAQIARSGLSITDIMLANERVWRTDDDVRAGLLKIWAVMQDCVRRGLTGPNDDGRLPGPLGVRRRAPALYRELSLGQDDRSADPLAGMDWVNAFAMAANEENASGGRVVTAPTNGAAGVIPAVLHY